VNKEFNDFLNDRRSYCEHATITYYNDNISAFIEFCKSNDLTCVTEIDSSVLMSYVSYLRSVPMLKNVSIKTYMRAVKVWVKWLADEKYILEDCTVKLKLPKDDSFLVRPLTKKEVVAIDNCFDCEVLGVRNYCIFHLMLDCGLRLSEVIHLNISDISENQLTINNSKFNKSRIVLCPDFLCKSIQYYKSSVTAPGDELFLLSRKNNRITVDAIKKLFTNLKLVSGVSRVHAHLCRHTFATSYVLGGGNLEMLRLLMGHADYNITQNYLHLANQQKLIRNDVYELDSIFFENYNNRKMG